MEQPKVEKVFSCNYDRAGEICSFIAYTNAENLADAMGKFSQIKDLEKLNSVREETYAIIVS